MSCPHGEHASYCLDCIEGPQPRKAPTRYPAERVITAMYDGRCASDDRHVIGEGEQIGLVDGLGWCCTRCIA